VKKTILILFVVMIVIVCFVTGNTQNHGDDGLIEAEDVSYVKDEDQDLVPNPNDTAIGDTFVGSTGTTYKLQEENISDQEKKDLADLGFIASGVWVPVDEDSDTGGNGGINTGGITITDTGGAGMMGDNPAEDIAVMPVGAQVGDTWTGPSGQTYIATFSNPELVSELAAQGIIVTPYWAPVGGN